MKNIIIAAGYATRLYPLTENFPKPLLKVGQRSILQRLLDDIDTIHDVSEHIVVTNHRFYPVFKQWANEMSYSKPIKIIDDGTETNETRLGAVRDLLLAVTGSPDGCNPDELDDKQMDDIMVLAADNILDFSLQGFVEFFHQKNSSVIMCHYEPELKKLQRTGVIEVDNDMRVIQMQEKPAVPVSNWAVPPFYIYKRADIPLICQCLSNGCAFDAPGNLAHYLVNKTVVHAWQMPGPRFDIGSLDSYEQAQKLFT